jgi:hypothetical protein
VAENNEVTSTLRRISTTRQYGVSGAPDTRGPGRRPITVRPAELFLKTYDGDPDRIDSVIVKGRTVRRDGQITNFRDVFFNGRQWGSAPPDELPAWVSEILRAEGLTYGAGGADRG